MDEYRKHLEPVSEVEPFETWIDKQYIQEGGKMTKRERAEYMRKWRLKRKHTQPKKEKVLCICGMRYSPSNKSVHFKSTRHRLGMDLQMCREENAKLVMLLNSIKIN